MKTSPEPYFQLRTWLDKASRLPRVSGYLLGFAGLFLLYSWLAVRLPFADDELYYWCWSKKLQLSYYDHPPMVAYLIWLCTAVFGDTAFAIRLPATLTTLTVLAVLIHLMKGRALVNAMILTPLFTFGAVLVTPDTPLLLFWSLYLLWLVKVHQRLTPTAGLSPRPVPWWLWLVGGVVLGCGVLGKYTMGLGAMAGGVTFLFARPYKNWVVGYVFHALISCAVASPILIYNIQHDFVPIQYQWGHAMATENGGLNSFAEFAGVQLLLFGFLPFTILPWVMRNVKVLTAEPLLRVCSVMFVLPFAFFIYKSLKGPLEGNWALAAYLGFWPIAANWYRDYHANRWQRRWTFAACAVPTGAVIVLAIHCVWPIPIVKPEQDRVTRQSAKVEAAFQVAEIVKKHGQPWPVFSPFYQNVSLLRYAGLDARQYEGLTRASHFTQVPEHLGDHDVAYVIHDWPLPDFKTVGFGPPEIIGVVPLTVRGKLQTNWLVMVYRKLPLAR